VGWDVLLLPLPEEVESIDDLPPDYDPPSLGTHTHVGALLRAVLPELDLSDPTWGQLLTPSGAVEFGKDTTTRVVSITLHVRGAGDDVLPVIVRSAAALGCRPVDCSQGELMVEPEAPAWRAFQSFRDRALRPRGHQP